MDILKVNEIISSKGTNKYSKEELRNFMTEIYGDCLLKKSYLDILRFYSVYSIDDLGLSQEDYVRKINKLQENVLSVDNPSLNELYYTIAIKCNMAKDLKITVDNSKAVEIYLKKIQSLKQTRNLKYFNRFEDLLLIQDRTGVNVMPYTNALAQIDSASVSNDSKLWNEMFVTSYGNLIYHYPSFANVGQIEMKILDIALKLTTDKEIRQVFPESSVCEFLVTNKDTHIDKFLPLFDKDQYYMRCEREKDNRQDNYFGK